MNALLNYSGAQCDYIEHIARISFGKDSLKMLDVIITRGLPLDRVTTTDVWATDTIRAELPDVLLAKERIEEKLWQMYRLEVDHLCARNKDGTKRTYEQMFYHIPNRRSQSVQVERERERETASGRLLTENRGQLPDSLPTPDTIIARSSSLPDNHIKGWPLSNGKLTWCQKLKGAWVPDTRIPGNDFPMVQKTQNRLCQNTLFN